MRLTVYFIILLTLLSGCASKEPLVHPSGVEITEIKPNKWTAITKQNLYQLAQVYDLSPFLYTKKIHVESQVVPHSHPVLTLNTRNAEKPRKLLSVWLHEEFHWWMERNKKSTDLAIRELKKIYPKAPATKSSGPDSTYIHLMVCFLEMKALSFYLGKKESVSVITEIMKKDKLYPWVYYQVLHRDYAIKKIMLKHKLIPPLLLETNKKTVAL